MSIEANLRQWDGQQTIIHHHQPSGSMILIGIHSTQLGPAAGGSRIKYYPNFEAAIRDVHRLAASMTVKFAIAGMDRGGGKAVISIPRKLDASARERLLLDYGHLIKSLGGLYETGPDVGSSSRDMDIIARTGSPYVFCRSPDNGGSGETGGATAFGVFQAMKAVCRFLYGQNDPHGMRVLVQGAGSVGGSLIDLLLECGAEVLVSELDRERLAKYLGKQKLEFVAPEDLFNCPCDIFSPCALGGVINGDTLPRLKCRAIVGGANNQVQSPELVQNLKDRNIVYAPDFAINAGGAMSAIYQEQHGLTREQAFDKVRATYDTTMEILRMADEENITTDTAAYRLAKRRLENR